MGVRHDDVRVSVRAVDIFLSFRWVAAVASGVSGGPSLCSGAQVGPKSYVLELRLASVGSERTAVVWCVLPAVLGRVRERLCHRDAQLGQLHFERGPPHRCHQPVAADLSLDDGYGGSTQNPPP